MQLTSLASIVIVGLVLLALQNGSAQAEQTAASAVVKTKKDGAPQDTTIRFLIALPTGYEDDKKVWPLLMFLHGAGERGDDLNLVKKHGPPKLVEAGQELPFVVVSPQCPKDSRWDADQLAKFVESLTNTHRIDKRQMYVTGLSMGGSGSWSLVAEFPGLFAAAAPICGRGDPAAVEIIAKTPVWAFVGAKDKAELVANNEELVTGLRKLRGKIELTVYPNVGHDSWTETYNNPKVYAWLLSHKLPE